MTDYEMGWKAAMARAMVLAAQLSPEGVNFRLRHALLKAMDNPPTVEAK